MNKKIILAIETSCDETAASLVKFRQTETDFIFEVLSNVVASQIEIHKKWGGVWPELASRAHLETMIPVLKESLEPIRESLNYKVQISNQTQNLKLKESKLIQNSKFEILNSLDAIAVTQGPGLIGSLLMGTETANILAKVYKKPMIPVNHLEGHVYSAFAEYKVKNQKSKVKTLESRVPDNLFTFEIPKSEIFPILALVVSGGHTSLVIMKDHLQYKTVGQTIDDAAGEAFDKVAKIMNLGYPGGPIIEKLAQKGNKNAYKLPIAIREKLDFSFSGLKTAVLYLTKDPTTGNKLPYNRQNLAASFQKTVVDTLILKTQKAINKYHPKTVILSGGVSANGYLRKRFFTELQTTDNKQMTILAPPRELSTDNAVGIAIAAALKTRNTSYVEADANLKL